MCNKAFIELIILLIGMTRHEKTLRKVTLYKGVYPARFDVLGRTHAEVNKAAIDVLDKATAEFAARRMDASIKKALTGHTLDEFIEE